MRDAGLLVLVSLSDGPKHGYAIQLDIESFARLRLGPGTLYGAINRLERDGAIAPVTSADRRKPYQLTPTGRSLLASRLELLQRLVTRAAAT
jgi:DNA-binding PadR family transcriptional regulator